MIFKYSELKLFLSHINSNYSVVSLSEWDGSNQIIMRHDVDLDIYPAYEIALIESEIGLRSTFLF